MNITKGNNKLKKGRFTNHFIKIMKISNESRTKIKQNIGTNKAKLVQMYKSEIKLYTIYKRHT